MLLTYAVLRLQHVLPLNPQSLPAVVDRQAFETAASFTTNTNWQSYAGESTMSYFSQMTPARVPQLRLGRRRHGAGGRAGPRHRAALRRDGSGNFWADLVRGTLYVLLPALARGRPDHGAAGRDPELQAVPRGHDARGRQADDRDGPGGQPGGHQADRHQRRRLLQRQRGASVREPDAVDELLVDVRDLPDPVRARPTCSAGWCGTSATAGRSGRRCSCCSSRA